MKYRSDILTSCLVAVLSLCMVWPSHAALAEEGKVNAGVLPVLWYSSVDVHEDDLTRIYGGIHNHSASSFTGQAVFMVDGEEVSSTGFISEPDTLIEVSGEWVAEPSKHKIILEIRDVDPVLELVSMTSGENELNVQRRITVEKVKEAAVEVTGAAVNKIDEIAKEISDKILEYRSDSSSSRNEEPPPAPRLPSPAAQANGGQVGHRGEVATGGTSSRPVLEPALSADAVDSEFPARSAGNLALAFLSASVLNWRWTLGAIAVLLLGIKLSGWK